VVAEADGEIIGVGAYIAARLARTGPLIPGMAHVAAVFVAEPWWGRGVGPALLDRLVERMRAAGYAEARLYTPVGQARARAFYAREGWREVAGPLPAPELGLDIMELRRPL
jgi:GNAT superfamily N-acetyltransferase